MPQVNTDTITGHIELMQLYMWGTHTEVIAAALLFQMPVYFIKESDVVHGEYHWQVICQLPPEKPHYPGMVPVDAPPVEMVPFTHFELVYRGGTHYDSIISSDRGKPCLHFPILTDTCKWIDTMNVVL